MPVIIHPSLTAVFTAWLPQKHHPAGNRNRFLTVVVLLLTVIMSHFFPALPVSAAGTLSITIIAAPNLVVDSNALSPSTYAPKVATVIGKICNPGDTTVSNVTAYIGDYTGSGAVLGTPGTYPVKTNVTIGGQLYSGSYSFTHLGGSADAARATPPLAAGECRYQYWSFEYPHLANGGTIPTWGNSVKPDDDLYLDFDIWAIGYEGATQRTANATHTATLRNEISAMANKIKPNGNPAGQWFNTDTSTVLPGEPITTNGILYRLGNVNQGFDNNDDGVPDYNAWVQPFGDPSYDPSCFRLIGASGVLTVTRSAGNPDLIIPFQDTLYFTDLPTDNTDVRGEVYYKFMAQKPGCTIPISPYQEVASGSDNEKFNGDYGAGVPFPMSSAAQVVTSKSAPGSQAESTTFTYQIPFQNNSTTTQAGLTLSSGGVNAGLMISDTVPVGLQYVGGSASSSNSVPTGNSVSIRYSTDSGVTWSSTDPGTTLSSSGAQVMLQWWLNEPLDVSGSGKNSGYVRLQATIPSGYITGGGAPFVENCSAASFGEGAPFDSDCATTMVQGTATIGDRVWADVNRDGDQTSESSIANITVWLYWDKNGNGALDSNDVLVSTQTTTAANPNYDFTSLPAGNYIVKVDSSDTDLADGYSPTTPTTHAVTLSAGQDYNNADFGFGPTLAIDKRLSSLDPAYVGETITHTIELRNQLPGDGTANGYCKYTLWASIANQTGSGSPPGGSTVGKQWSNTSTALGALNGAYASTDMADADELLGLDGFNLSDQGGSITKVELLIFFREGQNFISSSTLHAHVWDDTLGVGNPLGTYNYDDTYFSGSGGTTYVILQDVSSLRPDGGDADTYPDWYWSHFAADRTGLQLEADKGSGPDGGESEVDAAAFIITTNQTSCGGADKTIDPLPLTDTYDSTYLQYVSADPRPSSQSAGTIVWDNLDPLYAGGTKTITITFTALATVASTTNTASVTTATFANGRNMNDVNDSATVGINASGSIAGTVFADNHTTGTWTSGTGYSASDTFIPGVTVQLWGCFSTNTGLLINASTAGNTGKSCTDSSNSGEWRQITTQVTNSSGAYTFSGLRDGYYNVKVDTTTLPTDFTTNSVETNATGNGAGGAGGDSLWNTESANLSTFNNIVNGGSGENITAVSFGYIDGGGTTGQGAVIGYVWNDRDGDGTWDSGEEPIPGVTIYRCTSAVNPCNTSATTATTDTNGRYFFGNVTPGSYRTGVDTTDVPGMTQSGDPDQVGVTCSTCDNQTTTAFTVSANAISGSYNYGYTGGLSIGDTVYADWNGDGDQDSGEEGIANVTVRLYRDIDGDGVIDSGDTLLGTTTTNSSGNFSFSNLAGNGNKYIVQVNTATVPSGYSQTGDPDQAGTCTTCDSKASVTLNTTNVTTADFGYQPRGFSSIGDTVWNDADANGAIGSSESGIASVTVNLYQDQNGDGVIDAEDALVGTRATLGYTVIDGYIDISGNSSIGTDDDYTSLHGVNVIDGGLDIDGNGSINSNDDGAFVGYAVIDGRIDINASGSVSTADDGNLKGRYQFLNLAAGNYIVQIPSSNFSSGQPLDDLTQSYDQDSTTTRDNQDKVTLGASETYTSGDFGYTSSSIGDFIWQDNDGDGIWDSGEPGINGVLVELYLDANNDGTADGGAIASATTANNSEGDPGYYLFGGLSANNYIVKVAASNFSGGGALQNYTLTGDPNSYNTSSTSLSCLTAGATLCDNINWLKGVTVGSTFFPGLQLGQNDMSSDFGYQPNSGVIGDTVWIDSDNDGTRDADELGIAYITVWLCADSGCSSVLQTTATDENGYYSFSGLSNGTSYYVKVDTSDPDFPFGLTATYDRDGTANSVINNIILTSGHVSSVNSVACSNCDLEMDFGYRFSGSNTIQGTAWHDTDSGGQTGGVGDIDVGETTRYGDIPVYLWRCVGGCGGSDDILVSQTTTNSSGQYSFTSLADGDYRVVANSNAYSIQGTTTTTPMSYSSITLSGSTTAQRDFGFLSAMDLGDLPSSYNNTLLAENGARHSISGPYLGTSPTTDADGQESATAAGDTDNGVTVTSTPWSNGTNGGAVSVIVGGCTGACYLSAWLDWNQDGDLLDSGDRILLDQSVTNNGGSPQTITFDVPSGTFTGSGSNLILNTRFRLYSGSTDGRAQPTGLANEGEVEDYQWEFTPTGNYVPLSAVLAGFDAQQQGAAILVNWETVSEIGNLGFNLWRGVSPTAPDLLLNSALIPSAAPGSSQGFSYEWLDSNDLVGGTTYYYWLEDVDSSGAVTRHGPVSAAFSAPTAVRLTGAEANPPGQPLLWLALLGLIALAPRLRRRHRTN